VNSYRLDYAVLKNTEDLLKQANKQTTLVLCLHVVLCRVLLLKNN